MPVPAPDYQSASCLLSDKQVLAIGGCAILSQRVYSAGNTF